jgi:TatD DNase family protein
MIDSHCHLTHPKLAAETREVLERAAAAGVSACVTIGTGVDDAREARNLARTHPGRVFATAGLDPFSAHRAEGGFDDALRALRGLLEEGGFVAVGEIGLDYHYDLDPRPVQRRHLELQLGLAAELGLPVVIHVREAHEDMADVLSAHPAVRGVIHSFTAGPREAETYLGIGWKLAFNGVATFPNAREVRQAAQRVPADSILVETDAPYLAPAPHRGKRCEPSLVAETVRALAAERGVAAAELGRMAAENARALFRLPIPPSSAI